MDEYGFTPHERRHPVITLVGRAINEQRERFRWVNQELTLRKYVVISVGAFKEDMENREDYRTLLESIHFQKIDMADAVVLIDEKARGKHTGQEIDYAIKTRKPVVTFTNIDETDKQIRTLLNVVR